MKKLELLKNKYNLNSIFFEKFNKDNIKSIYDNIILLLDKGIISEVLAQTDQYYSLFIGMYYHFDVYYKEFDLIKKYYLLSINLGNSDAMNMLGKLYFDYTNNKFLIKKYLLMAYENKNLDSLMNLGKYYEKFENENDIKIIYLNGALEYGEICAALYLGDHYKYCNNYSLMKQYYLRYYRYYLSDLYYFNNMYTIYKKYNYSYL
jgi:hypothetical protein